MSEELIGAFDIRGKEGADLTVDVAWNVGKALADWLPTSGAVVIVYVPTHQHIASAIIEGLRLQGRDVIDGGHGDQDAARSHITTSNLAGGIVVGFDELEAMVTIELYQEDAKLLSGDTGLREIHELVQAGNFVPAAVKGQLLQAA
jgi:phosphomannomutase